VVADAALGNGLAEGFLEEDGIGDELEAVGRPGRRGLAVAATGLAALVFVGEVGAVASAEAIDLAGQAEGGAGEFEVDLFAVLVGLEGGVELAAGVDGGVGDADLLYFFEIEKPGAVGQGVQRHDADGGLMGFEDWQGDHNSSSGSMTGMSSDEGARSSGQSPRRSPVT
jgi:hypothetical protein